MQRLLMDQLSCAACSKRTALDSLDWGRGGGGASFRYNVNRRRREAHLWWRVFDGDGDGDLVAGLALGANADGAGAGRVRIALVVRISAASLANGAGRLVVRGLIVVILVGVGVMSLRMPPMMISTSISSTPLVDMTWHSKRPSSNRIRSPG